MLVCRRALAAATCRLASQYGVTRISAARCMQHSRMQQVAGWLADHLQFGCTSALLALPLTMTLPLACDVFISAIFFPLFIFFLNFFSHFLYASATAFLPRQQPVVVCLAFYFHSSCAQLFNDCNILHCAIVASCHKTLQPSMP